MRVMVANEPRAYREAFAGALRALRPNAEIIEAAPEDLDRQVKRLHPDLVLCTYVTPTVEKMVYNWILIYPEDDPSMMVFTRGELSTFNNFDLEDLISLVDRTAEMIEYERTPPF
jgi:hypothetical protein